MELENSIKCAQKIEVSRNIVHENERKMNRCQLKKCLDDSQKISETLESSQELIEHLKNTYEELCGIISNAGQMLHTSMRPSTEELMDKNLLQNFVKEINEKTFELLFKVICVENNCLKDDNEDVLSSDGESMQNLIVKDYNGIEIKKRRLVRM